MENCCLLAMSRWASSTRTHLRILKLNSYRLFKKVTRDEKSWKFKISCLPYFYPNYIKFSLFCCTNVYSSYWLIKQHVYKAGLDFSFKTTRLSFGRFVRSESFFDSIFRKCPEKHVIPSESTIKPTGNCFEWHVIM